MDNDEGQDEQTNDGDEGEADTSSEGQSNFFSQYADNELGIPDDSDRPSNSSRRSEANDDDDDSGDADTDGANRDADDDDDDDLEAGEEGDEDEDDDGEEEEEDEPAPKQKAKKGADEDDDEDLDPDFLEAAERNKLPANIEDVVKKLPAEARRPVRAALKGYLRDAQAGFTRLAQEQTAYRGERKQLVAELAFVRNHPDDFILEAILKDPKILDRVNERMPQDGDERARRVELKDIENRKKELAGKVEKNLDTQQQRQDRGEKLERFAKKLAAHYQIDYELVEDRLILEVQNSRDGDISEDRVREIIKARAQKIRGKAIDKRAADRKSFVQQKIADRKKGNSATARSRRLAGRIGAPARQKDSDDLRTNLARSIARIAPDMAKS